MELELVTYFNDVKNYLVDYFINKEIVINDKDDTETKIKKYLIKYKRLIGLVFLIILLIIGYFCFDDEFYNGFGFNNNNVIQKGGQGSEPSNEDVAAAKEQIQTKRREISAVQKATEQLQKEAQRAGPKTKAEFKAKYKAKYEDKVKAKAETKAALKEDRKAARRAASAKVSRFGTRVYDATAQKFSRAAGMVSGDKKLQNIRKGLTGTAKNVGSVTKGVYKVGSYAADKFRDNASWFYGIIYSVAIFIALTMIILPSLAFLVIGMVCYFLLKNKMKYFKSL